MKSLSGTREAFASGRKTVLTSADSKLRPVVNRALMHYGEKDWYQPILNAATKIYMAAFIDEAGNSDGENVKAFTDKLEASLKKTKQPGARTAERITRLASSFSVNAATNDAITADPEDLLYEWVTVHDNRVRPTHQAADGQQREKGEPFHVGESEMLHPGDTTAPPEEWAECRCVLRPAAREDINMTAAADAPEKKPAAIVGLPHKDDQVHGMGPEQKHVTLAYLGDDPENKDAINEQVAQVAARTAPFEDSVSGRGTLGPDDAQVLFMNGEGHKQVRDDLMSQPDIMRAHDAADQFPTWNPHMTLGYPAEGGADEQPIEGGKPGQKIKFDRLALWHGDEQTEHPLGGNVTAAADQAPVDGTSDIPTDEVTPVQEIPWHGVAVIEGAPTGDGRMFKKGSLRNRDLPLSLTWQRATAEGHDGSVRVGRIDGFSRVEGEGDNPNLVKFWGVFLCNADANEVIGEAASFGQLGVSVDIDDATASIDEQADIVEFTDARISGTSAVIIPAYQEAFIRLGPDPDMADPDTEYAITLGADTFQRGPGWVTNPEDTSRIHAYWTEPGQPGYEEIAWGTGGDFNRCRLELGKYVEPQYLNGTCAQWHHDALGIWPSTHAKELDGEHSLDIEADSGKINLVASAADSKWSPPRSWFDNPEFSQYTDVFMTELPEGTRIQGHVAEWGACHLAYDGMCVEPIDSPTDYRFFNNRPLPTDDGMVYAGKVTIGGGHADTRLEHVAAAAHYDDVATVAADVRAGRDEFGIWISGWVRPSATEEQRFKLMTTDLSGDWRRGDLMLVHAVNAGGFRRPAPEVSYYQGEQVGLVAAAARPRTQHSAETVEQMVEAAMNKREQFAARRDSILSMAVKHGVDPASRFAAIAAKHSEDGEN